MKALFVPYDKTFDDDTSYWTLVGKDRRGADFGVGGGQTVEVAEQRLKEWILDSLLAAAADGEELLSDLVVAPPEDTAVELGPADLVPIRLRLLRAKNKLTQAEVAKRLGLTQQAYSKLERPGANPQLRTLELIEGVLQGEVLQLDVAPANSGSNLGRLPVKIITTADLALWAQRTEARAQLPMLIYRLIAASGLRLRQLDFPAGEGVQLSGPDGVVVAEGNHPHVPIGHSIWEISVEHGVRAKAQKDYLKATTGAAGFDPSHSTFVAVTARNSNSIRTWAREKMSEGTWREVRAYDANTLANWINSLPAIALWFGRLIGKIPEGVIDTDMWWDQWAQSTSPPTTGKLVLAGLDDAIRKITDWIEGPPAPLTVKAATQDEAIAVAISGMRSSGKWREIARRAWVVESRETWAQIVSSADPLLILAAFEDKAGIEGAVGRQHHVLLPLDNANPQEGKVEIGARQWDAVRDALQEMGVPHDQTDELASVGRFSLTAVRRRLAVVRGITTPEWSQPQLGQDLLGPLLAGQWDDSNAGDREVIAQLAGTSYDSVLNVVRRWANAPDPPIRLAGSHWRFIDRMDAWLLLQHLAGREYLDRFANAVSAVLGELDPKFELPRDQQYAAAVYGKQLAHSHELREGLADMTALLATTGGMRSSSSDTLSSQDRACMMVRDLLVREPKWHMWASLSPYLPRLAEACPDEYVSALEDAVQEGDYLPNIFADNDGGWTSSSPHSGVLWGLEVVAWSPGHLGAATDALATLDERDPGGRLSNRPLASLAEIFKLWHPCTAASASVRNSALNALADRHPDTAWKVAAAILPHLMGVALPTARPKWREWAVEPSVSSAELADGIAFAVELMLRLAENRAERWAALVDLLDDVPLVQFRLILQRLRSHASDLDDAARADLWNQLREFVDRHREFPDARWALPATLIEEASVVLQFLTPADPAVTHGWLFTDWPSIPGRRQTDWETTRSEISSQRVEALETISTKPDPDALIAFARRVKAPHTVGEAAARMLSTPNLKTLLTRALTTDEDVVRRVGIGALSALQEMDPTALQVLVAQPEWTGTARADILAAMPFAPSTWTLVEEQDPEVADLYWRRVWVRPIPDQPDALAVASGALVAHERFEDAVRLLAWERSQASGALVHRVLLATAQAHREPPVVVGEIIQDIPTLLDLLYDANDVERDDCAKLEWLFLPLLHKPFNLPKALISRLQEEPGFFVEVLEQLYRRADEDSSQEATQQQKEGAHRAFTLLYEWEQPPGVEAGVIDEEAVRSWVRQARKLASDAGRKEAADNHIGQMLAHLPPGQDGLWPPDVLGIVLQESRSRELESGLSAGIHNKRGVTTRSLRAGGSQEWKLAADFSESAARVSSRFPRLARVLRGVAAAYEHHARREDAEADLE